LENVAALLTRGLDRVLGTLAEIGYDAEWHCIPAAYVGAPHIRDRVFVLAYANSQHGRASGASKTQARAAVAIDATSTQSRPMADTRCKLRKSRPSKRPRSDPQAKRGSAANDHKRCGETSAYANSEGLEKRQGQDAIGAGQDGRTELGRSEWWAVEPDVGRVAHGVPNRVDRLRGLGNAVVPQVAELVGKMVLQRLDSRRVKK
jgi:DNA (cytosine-5)-methyltransferase 1